MAEKPKRGRGRPPIPPAARKRNNVTIRLRDATKAALEAGATANKRSLSEEAEARIERSVDREDLLGEALDLAYGRQLAGVLMLLGRTMKDASTFSAFQATGTVEAVNNWLDNPWAFTQAYDGAMAALDALRPAGQPIAPIHLKSMPEPMQSVMADLGRGFASSMIEAIGNPERGGEIGNWAKPVRERLGSAAARIKVGSGSIAPRPAARRVKGRRPS